MMSGAPPAAGGATVERGAPAPPPVESMPAISIERLTAWYGTTPGVRDITMEIERRQITAIIGPSGCGKSTLLRSINRMHEVVKNARVEGRVLIDVENIYGPRLDRLLGRA